MRYPCLFVASIALVAHGAAGCQAEQGGSGTATDPSTTSSGGGTTEADGTASTAHGSHTGSDGTTVASTAGSDTEPSDGTASSSTASTESTGPAGTDTGDPPPEGEPYGPCLRDGTCMGADVACYANGGLDMCLPPCDGTNPSCPPPPPDNGSLVECVEVLGVHCMLNCAGGAQCPDGTSCAEVAGGIFRCLWP